MLSAIIAATALALTGPQVGAPAPDFHLTALDGKPVALTDFRGKTVVLNAWATWCPPCREETPDLIALAKSLGAKATSCSWASTRPRRLRSCARSPRPS